MRKCLVVEEKFKSKNVNQRKQELQNKMNKYLQAKLANMLK